MRYREQLSIILMRDNGPRRSFRLRRSRFFALVVFFASMPALCALLAWQCWLLWDENVTLRVNMQRFETDCQTAQATAERLENFEELLREEGVRGRPGRRGGDLPWRAQCGHALGRGAGA